MTNRLFYGDNLEILRNREYFGDLLGSGAAVDMPSPHAAFKQAERHVSTDGKSQRDLI